MNIASKKIIYLLSPLFLLSCSLIKQKNINDAVYVYTCEGVKLIYSPSDSTKIYIYSSFNSFNGKDFEENDIFPGYKDSTIIELFETGQITRRIIMGSALQKGNFTITNRNIFDIASDSCFSVVPDSNNLIVELMRTSTMRDDQGKLVHSFQVVYEYGTDHYCYELKEIDKNKYSIEFIGEIL